jgi:sialic acid synthase SpsE
MSSRRPFIVAELSANHLGSLERALQIVDAAKAAGADAVKFQTYTVKALVADPDHVIPSGPWAGRSAGDLYSQAMTPRSWHETLFAYARALEIEPFSTPFSPDDVDFLEELRCPRYKIASFELVDHELIRYVASKGKPMIMSTGMATAEEIMAAALAAEDAGCIDLTLLKCTSGYPAPIEEANLATIQSLGGWKMAIRRMEVKAGLSDHTRCGVVPIAAAALGAQVIEAHLTLRRADGGPDAAFSYEPEEFELWAESARVAAMARGEVRWGPTASEQPQLAFRGRTVRARAHG